MFFLHLTSYIFSRFSFHGSLADLNRDPHTSSTFTIDEEGEEGAAERAAAAGEPAGKKDKSRQTRRRGEINNFLNNTHFQSILPKSTQSKICFQIQYFLVWHFSRSVVGSLSIPAPLKSFSTLTRKLSASNSLFIDSLPRSRSTSTTNGFGRTQFHIK